MEENANQKLKWQEKLTNSLKTYFEGPKAQEYHFHLSDSSETEQQFRFSCLFNHKANARKRKNL